MKTEDPRFMRLTDLDLERCQNANRAFVGEVVRILGEDIRVKGWHRRLRDKRVLRADYERARSYAQLPRLKGVERGEATGQLPLL